MKLSFTFALFAQSNVAKRSEPCEARLPTVFCRAIEKKTAPSRPDEAGSKLKVIATPVFFALAW